MIFQFSKSSGGSGKDPAEEELKKRRKRKIDSRGSASNKNKPATDNHTMIITFATQKGGAGKTTLALAFANYLTIVSERKINVFDYDYQKSFFNKWKEDEYLELPKLYDVEVIGDEDEEQPFADLEKIIDLKESKEIYLFDLAGTLDQKYSDLLIYSDFIIIPFEYSDVSVKSTLVFKTCWGFLKVRQSGSLYAPNMTKAINISTKRKWI